MPVVFRYRGYCFFFFSNEGNPLEPCHIHIIKNSNCFVWLVPEVKLAESYGLSSPELRKLSQLVKQNEELIKEKWNAYFS